MRDRPPTRPVPAPEEFDRAARLLWHAAQRQLRAQGTWQDTDAPILECYVSSVSTARRARSSVLEPFVAGSKGQLVAHPGIKVAAEAERDAARYATALLLTPQARRRHSVSLTEHDRDPLEALIG